MMILPGARRVPRAGGRAGHFRCGEQDCRRGEQDCRWPSDLVDSIDARQHKVIGDSEDERPGHRRSDKPSANAGSTPCEQQAGNWTRQNHSSYERVLQACGVDVRGNMRSAVNGDDRQVKEDNGDEAPPGRVRVAHTFRRRAAGVVCDS
jgi:hypothetical protein